MEKLGTCFSRPLLGLLLFSLVAISLSPSSARAIFEVRGHYGYNSIEPRRLNSLLAELDVPKATSLWGFGLDFLVMLPTVPIGFGLRYESLSIQGTSDRSVYGMFDYETAYSRIALLINYRLVDNNVFFGHFFYFCK